MLISYSYIDITVEPKKEDLFAYFISKGFTQEQCDLLWNETWLNEDSIEDMMFYQHCPCDFQEFMRNRYEYLAIDKYNEINIRQISCFEDLEEDDPYTIGEKYFESENGK